MENFDDAGSCSGQPSEASATKGGDKEEGGKQVNEVHEANEVDELNEVNAQQNTKINMLWLFSASKSSNRSARTWV